MLSSSNLVRLGSHAVASSTSQFCYNRAQMILKDYDSQQAYLGD